MVILVRRWLYPASTIGPIIIMRRADYNTNTLNHEYIHTRQQLECLYIFAYLFYFIELVVKSIYYKSVVIAYANLSFEREAYTFQHVIGYAHNRKHFVWLRYVYVPTGKLKKIGNKYELVTDADMIKSPFEPLKNFFKKHF